ncbi:MAG: hypothetical protein JOZ74_18205 [Bradyrhizobium sp.]|nr:hypothetical protein [Bradyrhizobium sp.]
MATTISTTLSAPAMGPGGPAISTGFKAFWRQFFARAFDPYRPELHYMRGPGPAWRAKYGADASFRLKQSGG